jgi:hypothetical protein
VPITRSTFNTEEMQRLKLHLEKHKVYPFQYRFRKVINSSNFGTADGSIGSYFTLTFTPNVHLGIVSMATNFVVTPNTSVGIFMLAASYRSTVTLADNTATGTPDDEANEIYRLMSNGGAINDFQVFYPLNWYLEAGKPFYLHVYADATTVAANNTTITGHFILGTLLTGIR